MDPAGRQNHESGSIVCWGDRSDMGGGVRTTPGELCPPPPLHILLSGFVDGLLSYHLRPLDLEWDH